MFPRSRRSSVPMPVRPTRRRGLGQLLATAASAALPGIVLTHASPVRAQAAAAGAWPNRTIRLVVPSSPGGGGDIIARMLAERMRVELGQPVVIENRPGAGGNLGAEVAARAAPDGYTILSTTGGFAIAPSIYKGLSFDPVKDFVPVTKMATAPLLVLVRADSPLRTMDDLVALSKRDPKAVSFGSFGNGSPAHLIGEAINRVAGISMTHVPYTTTASAAADLQGGLLTIAVLDALSMTPQVRAGRFRALALNGTNRLPTLPDVPTLPECGIPFDMVGWHAMFVPAGTPREIVERLNRLVNQIVAIPEVRTKIIEVGSFPVQPPTTVEQWGAQFRDEVQKWAEVVRWSGASIN
jgi:tripartite-type tricarboxylate transporter receptor subunit TctC